MGGGGDEPLAVDEADHDQPGARDDEHLRAHRQAAADDEAQLGPFGEEVGEFAAAQAKDVVLRVEPADHAREADRAGGGGSKRAARDRSEEHTSELQSLMRNSYAVFC